MSLSSTEGTWQSPLIECLLIGAKLTSTYRRATMERVRHEAFASGLRRGEVQGYDFNRMVFEFTMLNQGR